MTSSNAYGGGPNFLPTTVVAGGEGRTEKISPALMGVKDGQRALLNEARLFLEGQYSSYAETGEGEFLEKEARVLHAKLCEAAPPQLQG